MKTCDTDRLRIAYIDAGPRDGEPLLLLHGWPDDPRTFDKVLPALHAAGFRTYAPWLRGFGATRFRSADTMRSGEMVAIAKDMLDFADALELSRFSVVGHDWGARTAYNLACLAPERLERMACIAVAWEPGELKTPSLGQAQSYWYQWFLCTDPGVASLRNDGRAFARRQWENWAPRGWFSDAEFDATASSFDNPDWAAITIHSYRVRWGEADKDPHYAALDQKRLAARSIAVPTLLIHGEADGATLAATSEDKDRYFDARYVRRVLPGIGHFPTREAPVETGRLILEFFKSGQQSLARPAR